MMMMMIVVVVVMMMMNWLNELFVIIGIGYVGINLNPCETAAF
jgi:hypothetical protein